MVKMENMGADLRGGGAMRSSGVLAMFFLTIKSFFKNILVLHIFY